MLVGKLLYVEEMHDPEIRYIKFWYRCDFVDGRLDCTAREAISEYIVDVRFMKRQELKNHTVFPSILNDACFEDITSKNGLPQFIALHKMEFY